jgi:hypothetical protein
MEPSTHKFGILNIFLLLIIIALVGGIIASIFVAKTRPATLQQEARKGAITGTVTLEPQYKTDDWKTYTKEIEFTSGLGPGNNKALSQGAKYIVNISVKYPSHWIVDSYGGLVTLADCVEIFTYGTHQEKSCNGGQTKESFVIDTLSDRYTNFADFAQKIIDGKTSHTANDFTDLKILEEAKTTIDGNEAFILKLSGKPVGKDITKYQNSIIFNLGDRQYVLRGDSDYPAQYFETIASTIHITATKTPAN